MTSELNISSITLKESGQYICTATLEERYKSAVVNVTVYGKYVMDTFCGINLYLLFYKIRDIYIYFLQICRASIPQCDPWDTYGC